METRDSIDAPLRAPRALGDGRLVRVRAATADDAAGVLAVRAATVRERDYTIVQSDELDLDVAQQRRTIEAPRATEAFVQHTRQPYTNDDPRNG